MTCLLGLVEWLFGPYLLVGSWFAWVALWAAPAPWSGSLGFWLENEILTHEGFWLEHGHTHSSLCGVLVMAMNDPVALPN